MSQIIGNERLINNNNNCWNEETLNISICENGACEQGEGDPGTFWSASWQVDDKWRQGQVDKLSVSNIQEIFDIKFILIFPISR